MINHHNVIPFILFVKTSQVLPTTGFLICGGGGGGICCLLVQELGDEPLCRLSHVLLRLLRVIGESPGAGPPPPAYEGGLLRDFFSGVRQPLCGR